MIIRPAEDKDRSVLTSLHISEDLERYKESTEVFRGWKLSTLSSRARDIILVAEDEDEVRGYLWAVALRIFDYRIGIVFDLYVDTAMRQKGVGRQLLEKGIEELRKLGVHRIWANVEKKNAPTRVLLEHHSFSFTEEKVFYQLVDPDARHEWGTESS
jgi:L-amino acid N-acyltransferase YncA